MTQLPRLLNADFTERARVRPTAYSPTLQRRATSTAKLSLPQDVPVAMHDWFELFTPAGSAGLFRVTDIDDTVPTEIQYTLLHGIDTLSDSVWKAQTDYSGTCAGFLAALLAQQTAPLWQLGECDAAFAYKRSGINYDYLNDLLAEFMEDPRLNDYYLTYDFSTTPWTLNLKAAPEGVRAEFRLSRNVERCQVRRSDADQCTRLYLSVNTATTSGGVTTNSVVIRTYNNAAAQALYGVIEKTADIDTADVPDPDAWAADFMARRAHPAVQIQIDGLRLKDLTGLDWDESTLAALTRVALPAIAETLEERVESLSWPDPLRDARRVTVSLANRLPKFSDTIASRAKKTARAGAAARGAARGGASGKELEHWAQIVSKHAKAMDDTGITDLWETGIVLDAVTGATIYSLQQGYVSQYAAINVNSAAISAEVQRAEGAETGLSSRITQTATEISSEVTNRQNADNALSSRITQNAEAITSKVSAGDIASTINQTAQSVLIQASKINLEGYVTASELSATNANITNLTNGTTQASHLDGALISGTTVTARNTLVYRDDTIYKRTLHIGSVATLDVLAAGGNTSVDFAHYHAISASEGTGSNAGKILITLGDVQASEGSTNFNIAATQFYQDGVAAAFQQGTDNGAWNYAAFGATNTGTKSWASDSKSCVINVTVLDRNNRTYGPYEITVDTRKAYSDGWTKGFQDGSEA